MRYFHPKRIKKIYDQWLLTKRLSYNYGHVIQRLRKKVGKEKIKVVFYTNEPQKWSYDSVYREFENSPYFDPLVVVVPRWWVHKGKDNTRMSLKEQFDFYKERNYKVEYGYVDGEYLEIASFKPDIFFYLQLAEVPGIDDPLIVSKNAITCYCPYAYQLSDFRKHYLHDFHRLLYVNYMEHELTLKRFESYCKGNSNNCVAVGYPKLDVYLEAGDKSEKWQQFWKNPGKFKIIYAPHHSFADELFNWGTFPDNCQLILSIAKNNPETTWMFKPHPMLKSAVIRHGVMTEKEIDAYYAEWSKIGVVYDNGDYFEAFKSSDLMITDCGSFLAEYLPSHNPLIRLVNKDGCALNELGEKFSGCYYNVYNNEELLSVFHEIVVRRNDYMRDDRICIADSLVNKDVSASSRIYDDLLHRIKK